MNAVTTTTPKPMLLEFMADKYGLRPQEFADTVRKTCGLANATPEEFAAFVMVAREYDLNPLLREIYAFPKRGGGIVPIVSIDGWIHMINGHPACDGFEFEHEHADATKDLISITCRMYRKDRTRPVVVTEYLVECYRETEPWKMKHRMLRHKTLIQAARYAFGFSGVYDEDEGAKIAESTLGVVESPPVPPKPPATKARQEAAAAASDGKEQATEQKPEPKPRQTRAKAEPQKAAEQDVVDIDPETGEVLEGGSSSSGNPFDEAPAEAKPAETKPAAQKTEPEEPEQLSAADQAKAANAFLDTVNAELKTATTEDDVEAIWDRLDVPSVLTHYDSADTYLRIAFNFKKTAMKRVGA